MWAATESLIRIPGLEGLSREALQAAWLDGARTGAFAAAILVIAIILGLFRRK